MSRRSVGIVVGALLLVGLGGFGAFWLASLHSTPSTALAAPRPTTCADAYKLLKLTPSEVMGANPVCLNQSLQLSGEVVGTVGQAYTVDPNGVAPTPMCSVPKRWNGYPPAMLAFVVGGKGYRLRISTPGSAEHQALTLSSLTGVVQLASISDPKVDWSQASGTLAVNSDGTTGTIDADLLRDISGARPVHIAGKWACGAPLPQLASDASVPCSSFYALNQLHDADVARMKSSACQADDLTFSGDVNAHVDHAVTDTATSPHPGIDGDNFCGSVGEAYTAALKFSLGDESFLLDLNARQYPAVGPGQYSASSSSSSAGATLWLGRADPANQGQFVTDDRVSWIGSGGTFSIAPDMKSGSVDATLSGLSNHAGSVVRVKGTWRCAA
jgi:hypothetical protein